MTQQKSILVLVVVFSCAGTCFGKYSGGTGEPNDPYIIATAEDMNEIGTYSSDWNAHFLLVADINLADYTGTQFNIIGNSTTKFTGVFDGNDHKVWNFTWTSTSRDFIGLFGYVGTGGEVKNLGMENIDVNAVSGYYVGGLVGYNYYGTITNCYSTGSVSGLYDVGGLVGVNDIGTITNCYSSGRVTGEDEVGGLVGYNYNGTVSRCTARSAFRRSILSHPVDDASVWTPYYATVSNDTEHFLCGGTNMQSVKLTKTSSAYTAGWMDYVYGSNQDVRDIKGRAPFIKVRFYVYEGSGDSSHEKISRLALMLGCDASGWTNYYWCAITVRPPPQPGWHTIILLPSWGASYGSFFSWGSIRQIRFKMETYNVTDTPSVTLDQIEFIERLPKALYMMTLDDGNANQYEVAAYLAQKGLRGTFYIIPNKIDTSGYLTLDQLKAMKKAGHLIANHGWAHKDWKMSTDQQMIDDIVAAKEWLVDNGLGEGAGIYALPYGGSAWKLRGEDLFLCKYLDSIRLTAWEPYANKGWMWWRPDLISTDPFDNVTNADAALTSAINNGCACIVGFHNQSKNGVYTFADLKAHIDNVAQKVADGEIEVVTPADLLSLVGNNDSGTVVNCYSTGSVAGTSYVGGLVGYSSGGTTTASFWDIETGGPDNGIGTPLPTEQMQTESTFTDAGWDFVCETENGTDEVWTIKEGVDYPKLFWQWKDYQEWLAVGKPLCWCCPRQCHGDADNTSEYIKGKGYYHVHFKDLNILLSAWNIKEPPDGLGIAWPDLNICADFDHDTEYIENKGYYRVHFSDLNTLLKNWNVKEPPDGPGIEPNCIDCP